MSFLILAPTVRTHAWEKQLRRLAPDLDLRVWPETGDPDEVLFVLCWRHPPGVLDRFPNLACIASMGAGVDHILSDPELPRVPIVRVVDPSMARSMTEYLLLAVLHRVRQFDLYRLDQMQRAWRQRVPAQAAATRIGIMGLGELGRHAARAFRSLEFPVSGWSRTPKTIEGVQTFAGEEGFGPFLSNLRVLICLLPLTDATRGILCRRTFAGLPDGAYLINSARGEHLIEEDLLEALDDGKVSGACLDVFRTEPLPGGHPFWGRPEIRVTPHISSLTNPKDVCPQILENYRRLLEGRSLLNLVDREKGY
ncbi:MAG: glyoxylate/hydroxypyruvate reductase A [Desulfobacterales bacterium]|jgi:glyoxylate/hydroxypyruvate reductase A